ncbi:hypothetical protein Acr_06g0008090 [Actinidia rufa]|uniref:Reverse transcriptase domain-containing protein n=1 Tax=Actinidia rufa TaxID=165716 RepID=A0A7J0ES96_9ERIC|nr:hypothetical protein Acr_06g0008090 [Actinidia rufa]
MGAPTRGEEQFKKQKENPIDFESRARQGINVIFKEPYTSSSPRFETSHTSKKLEPMGGDPRRRNQRWRCSFHEERGQRTDSCRALKSFLDQLVKDGHLKEFIDEGMTRAKKDEANPIPRFDCGDDEADTNPVTL